MGYGKRLYENEKVAGSCLFWESVKARLPKGFVAVKE